MARIRNLKPEFWDSPSTAKADLAPRLVFMAMWNWADDSGRGTANLKELEAFCFPNDDISDLPRRSSGNSAASSGNSAASSGNSAASSGNSAASSGTWRSFAEICGEVAEAYGVVFYRVNNRPYYQIPSFKEHQAKYFRPTSNFPSVEEGEIYDVTSGNAVNDSKGGCSGSGNSAASSGNSAASSGNSPLDKDRDKDRDKDISLAQPAVERAFDSFWHAYPRKVGKQKARTKFAAALKRADADTITAGAHRLAADPNLPEKQFIPHPTTWLERDGWDDEPLPARTAARGREEKNLAVLTDFVHRAAGWKAIS